MCPRESLRFVTEAHRHLSPVCEAGCASQPQRRRTALAESHQMKACASQDGSQSAVALGVGLGSLAHRGWRPSSERVSVRTLRQSYITPHCIQCPPVNRRLLLWRSPLRALRVNATGVMQNCLRWSGRQSSALPGRFAPYAPPPVALVVCWRCGICQALRALVWSAASPCILCWPPPTLGSCLLRSFARAVCPSAPQVGSLRTARIHAA